MRGCLAFFRRVSAIVALVTTATCLLSQIAAADSFDWRYVNGQNWNSAVESQFGGTCWDFSACGTLEAKYKLTRNDSSFDPDVSEQAVDWEGYMGSMNGGWGPAVLDYFTSHGVVSVAEVPNLGTDTPTAPYWPLAAGWQNRVWKSVSNLNDFTNDTDLMKAYIKTTGPLEVGIWASHDLYGSVASLKASYRPPDASGFDHEVSLVGYYDDASVPTGGYWVIKNSWGTGEGEGGYDYIPYGNIEIHNDVSAITGAVYYTGAMAAATWKGGSGTWSSGGNNWTNNANGSTYAWQNQETTATFNGSSGTAITISGSVISHGLSFSSGASGYTFSGGSLTVTAGGIAANESVTFNSAVYIGGPQSWNVASGKTLTINGPLHTIISDLTFSGAGNTVVSGQIDGGGVLNTYGGAKPGSLIQSGAGMVTLYNTLDFAGDITASGSGPLNISPTGGGSVAYSGAWLGGGSINVTCSGTFSLGGGASNFSGTLNMLQPGTLRFVPAAGITSSFRGVINSGGSIVQDGLGTTVLSGTNNYAGSTTISGGALQANIGTGIPSTSFLKLDGGVLQSDGSTAVSFTRSLGASGSAFQWTANGGGFSAGSTAMNVSIGMGIPLTWGTTVGSQMVGTLLLSSPTAGAVTTFQNAVDLNGADRTIFVDDNPNSAADYAVMSGVISGSAGIVKTGSGLLSLTGANSYSGTTTVAGGVLQAGVSGSQGIPTASFISLNGGVLQVNGASGFTRSLGTSGGTFELGLAGGGFSAGTTPASVNIGGQASPITVVWGSGAADVGTKIVGSLTLNSSMASNSLTFQNGIDLNGGARSLVVNGNVAYLQGVISDGVGGGSLTKSGVGTLYLSGSSGNTYSGATTILGGDLHLNKASGYAIPGDLYLGGNTHVFVYMEGDNQIAPTSKVTWIGTGDWQEIKLLGHNLTVAGLSDATSHGVIQNTWDESGYAAVTLTINNSTDCSFNGVLRDTCYGNTGAMSLVKTGTGTQTLSGGGLSYTGGTTVSNGKLVLRDITNTDFAARGIVNDAVLELDSVNSVFTFSGPISGTGSVNVAGSNVLTIGGASGNTYTGATTISAGTVNLAKTSGYAIPGDFTIANGSTYVVVQGANQFPATANVAFSGFSHFEVYGNNVTVGGISGAGVIENTERESGLSAGTLTVNNSANCSYSGYLRNTNGGSGTLALVKDGPGTLSLTGTNVGRYTGGLTVRNGTLDYSGAGTTALPAGSYTIAGGTLNTGSRSKTIGLFQITGGTVTGTGTLTSTAAYDIQGGTVDVILGGYGIALNKTGEGTAALTRTNTYRGTTTINGGTLQLGNGGTTGALSSYTSIVVNPLGTFAVNHSNTVTFSSKISGAGTLENDGTGTLALTGSNTFTGNLLVNNGTLDYSGNSTLPAGNYTVSGGTLNLGSLSKTMGTFQISGGTATGTGTLTAAGYELQSGTINVNFGGSGPLSKTTTGTISLTKSVPTGDYSISDGTLNLNGFSLSIGTLQTLGGTLTGTGTLTPASYDLEGGTIDVNLGGTAALNKAGSGTVSLLKNLPGGNYSISGGTLNLNGFSQSIGTFQITGGAVVGTGTLTSNADYDVQAGTVGVVLGGGTAIDLHKTGAGTAILAATNTYSGQTAISGGVLQADFGVGIPSNSFLSLDGGVFESVAGGTFIRSLGSSGGTFQFTANGGGFSSVGSPLTVNVGGSGAALAWGTGVGSQIAGPLKFGSANAVSSVTFVNGINLDGADRTVEVDDNPNSTGDFATLSGVIADGSGSGGIVKTGAGTLYLTGSNTYSGVTSINAGVVQLQNVNGLGSAAGKTVVAAGALLVVSGGLTGTINEPIDLSGSGDGNGALQVVDSGTDVTFAGTINLVTDTAIGGTSHFAVSGNVIGSGSLTKYGTNRVDLTGIGTFSGDTHVVSGILGVSGSTLQNSTLNLAAGDTGAVDFASSGFTLGGLKGSRDLSSTDNSAVVSIGGNNQSTTYSGVLSNMTLNKVGAGMLTLTGMNTFSGGVTVGGGTLSVGVLAANGSSSGLGAGASLTLDGGTLLYTGGANSTFNRSITLGPGGGVIDQSGTGALYSNGQISGSGSLTKTGAAQLVLPGDNSYSGQTNINAGAVEIFSVGALGSAAGKTVVATGAVLTVGGGLTGTINEPIDLNGGGIHGSGALQVVDSGTDVAFAGTINVASTSVISGTSHYAISGDITGSSAVTLSKSGSNRVDLTGATSFAGNMRVAAGTLSIASNCAPIQHAEDGFRRHGHTGCRREHCVGRADGQPRLEPGRRFDHRFDRQQQPEHDVQRRAEQHGCEEDRHGHADVHRREHVRRLDDGCRRSARIGDGRGSAPRARSRRGGYSGRLEQARVRLQRSGRRPGGADWIDPDDELRRWGRASVFCRQRRDDLQFDGRDGGQGVGLGRQRHEPGDGDVHDVRRRQPGRLGHFQRLKRGAGELQLAGDVGHRRFQLRRRGNLRRPE